MNARGTIPVKIAGEGGLKSDAIRSLVPTRSHHRIISITVHNTGTENLTRAVVWLPQVDERREVNIPVGGWKRVFFTLPERANRKKLSVQLRRAGEIIVEMEKTLGPAKTGPKQEADLLRHELQEEQKVRDKWVRRALTIRTVSNASLTMIHRELGLLRTAKTGSNGVWKGRLLGGDWEVLVRSVRYPRKMPTGKGEGTTAVLEQPYVDLTYLAGKVNLKSSSREVEILPDRHGEVSGPVLPETLSLSPSPFTKSLRYETVHRSAGNDLILRADFTKGGPVSRIRFHTTSNLAFDLLGWSRSGLTGLTRFVPEGEVSLEMEKRKSGRVIFDPAALPGCVGLDLSFSCPSRPRERYSLSISERTGITVPAGNLRVQFQARMEGGGILHFSPSVHRIAGGRGVDLSPTPLRLFPHFQPTRGLLLWLAVVDDRGRFVTRFRGISGTLEGFLAGKPIFSREIGELTFHFPNQFEGLAVDAIQYRVKLNIGGEVLPYKGPAFPRRQFDDPPAHVVVPEMLEEKARAVMPMVRKTLGGSLRTFGLPKFDLTLKFEIRLPPDVGGLGGGGKILLDIGQILNYAHETDSLPGAYTHELGHCLGFGHDPYMTMAPCGADEGLSWPCRCHDSLLHEPLRHRSLTWRAR